MMIGENFSERKKRKLRKPTKWRKETQLKGQDLIQGHDRKAKNTKIKRRKKRKKERDPGQIPMRRIINIRENMLRMGPIDPNS